MTTETDRPAAAPAIPAGAEAPSLPIRPVTTGLPVPATAARPVRLLMVGTGNMGGLQARGFAAVEGVQIVASVDTHDERREAFNREHGIPRGFASIQQALDWGEFDAVTNITPDAVHYVTTMPFLRAGKHVLCEKPLAANYPHAHEMAEAAALAGVVNMVNLTYRNVAAINEAARLVAEGAIGEVRHFEASYLQSWLTQPAWGEWSASPTWLWRLSKGHGSMGVLGDVGVHILDFATFAAGSMPTHVSCRLATFDKAPGGRIGEYVLDANDSAVMHLRLANGATGVMHATRYATGHLNDLTLKIFGTKGGLEVRGSNNYSALRGSLGEDILTGTWCDLDAPPVPTNYARFIAAIRSGTPVMPDFARGAALQKVLDLAIASDEARSLDMAV
ncbi:putative dehydrogenase/related protein [Rubellimicrobium thermophilum DSM 16684]|uniref:Putative dehydrogenase/related protein n=1 Tax=Rubellimicrobium thermophilum DSM 16684 TaxID=1123069 RepID=S9QX46_9RHOB|nr:Gfo/Idh/MocA family oxidoreductase [Rubellimicrobium thermophilum]EPX84188.1 putative dehydrogenase/related protein [Rubellimicrobium thermophilum DSM 16684]